MRQKTFFVTTATIYFSFCIQAACAQLKEEKILANAGIWQLSKMIFINGNVKCSLLGKANPIFMPRFSGVFIFGVNKYNGEYRTSTGFWVDYLENKAVGDFLPLSEAKVEIDNRSVNVEIIEGGDQIRITDPITPKMHEARVSYKFRSLEIERIVTYNLSEAFSLLDEFENECP